MSRQPLASPAVIVGLVVVPRAVIRALAVVASLAKVIRWAIASMLVIAVAVVVHLREGGSRQPAPPNQHVRERTAAYHEQHSQYGKDDHQYRGIRGRSLPAASA